MVYLLALIGLVAVLVLLWKAFGPDNASGSGRAPVGRVSGPDDDPDFLWKLERDKRSRRDSASGRDNKTDPDDGAGAVS